VPPVEIIKTVRTNVLEIGYHESGDASGWSSKSPRTAAAIA
jgi:hypothetical protein